MVQVVIHTNFGLGNQMETARWLRDGFARHGIAAEITPEITKAADIHVVQGPWYALKHWQPLSDKHRVLYLNRGFWGDAREDLSLGWLKPNGTRDFRSDGAVEANGYPLQPRPRKANGRCAIVFGDYGRDPTEDIERARRDYDSVFFRPHPQQIIATSVMTLSGPLEDAWSLGDVALGHSSTVLVQARIEGLRVESSDPLHVVHAYPDDDERWLRELSWAMWHYTEIEAGLAWEHLLDH
jgi:hypothetical protein